MKIPRQNTVFDKHPAPFLVRRACGTAARIVYRREAPARI
jgi:hypothetical protein